MVRTNNRKFDSSVFKSICDRILNVSKAVIRWQQICDPIYNLVYTKCEMMHIRFMCIQHVGTYSVLCILASLRK